MRSFPRLFATLALALAATGATPAGAATRVAVQPESAFSAAQRVALLRTADDGSQTLTLRTVSRAFLKGPQPGDRLGPDVVLDLAAIWGSRGTFVDVLISSILKPGSVFLLTDDLHVLELQGIWGNGNVGIWGNGNVGIWGNGNVGIWGNGNVGMRHGPLWDTTACGGGTALAEGVRPVALPGAALADPYLAIGTAGGCVGLVGVPDPTRWFPDIDGWFDTVPDVDEWLTAPLEATGDPLVDVAGAGGRGLPVTDLLTIPTPDRLIPVPTKWVPSPDEWLPLTPEWVPDPNDWHPDPAAWVPQVDLWYDVGAVVGGDVALLHPGTRAVGDHLGAPPFLTSRLLGESAGARLLSLAGTTQAALDWPPQLPPEGAAASVPVVGADGTLTLQRAELAGAPEWGTTADLPWVGTTPIAGGPARTGLVSVELGSLWAVDDGGALLFAPNFDPATGELGEVFAMGGVQSVDLGPRAFQLRSRGRFVSASIEATGDDVLEIDPTSVVLAVAGDAGEPVAALRATLHDADDNGDLELVAKFDRRAVAQRLTAADGEAATLVLLWSYAEICDQEGNPCRGGYPQPVKIVD